MSKKLAIIFGLVFLASAANSFLLSSTLSTIQNSVEAVISAAIAEVRGKTEAAQVKAQSLAVKLMDESTKFGRKIHNEIKAALKKAEEDVKKLGDSAEGVNVTDCTEKASGLNRVALAALANTSACIVDKLETGSGYVESINKVSNDVIADLTKIRGELRRCGDDAGTVGLKSTAAAIACANAAGVKAAMVSPTVVPAMLVKTTELSFLLGTLQPSLAYCAASNGLVTFQRESSNIVDETKKCVRRKIDDAHIVATSTSTSTAATKVANAT